MKCVANGRGQQYKKGRENAMRDNSKLGGKKPASNEHQQPPKTIREPKKKESEGGWGKKVQGRLRLARLLLERKHQAHNVEGKNTDVGQKEFAGSKNNPPPMEHF